MDASGKWAKRGVWLTLAAVIAIGCNPITLPFVLLRTESKLEAQYPLRPKEGPKHDKDVDIKVLVLASMAPGSVTPEFAGVDRELAAAVAKKLPEVGKANKEVFTVIRADQLDTFKYQNPSWRSMSAAAIGKKLGADYVLEVSLSGLQMYQPGSLNQIYEGKVQVSVELTDTASQRDPPIRYPFTLTHPGLPRTVDTMSASQFKLEMLDKLAQEIVFRHVDHKAADGIAAR